MKKSEFCSEFAGLVREILYLDLSRSQSDVMFDLFIETIKAQLEKEGKCVLTGLGTLTVKERAARRGRNPKTGEAIDIPAKKRVAFKAGAALKRMVA